MPASSRLMEASAPTLRRRTGSAKRWPHGSDHTFHEPVDDSPTFLACLIWRSKATAISSRLRRAAAVLDQGGGGFGAKRLKQGLLKRRPGRADEPGRLPAQCRGRARPSQSAWIRAPCEVDFASAYPHPTGRCSSGCCWRPPCCSPAAIRGLPAAAHQWRAAWLRSALGLVG